MVKYIDFSRWLGHSILLIAFSVSIGVAEVAVDPTHDVVADVILDEAPQSMVTDATQVAPNSAPGVMTAERIKALVDSGIYSPDNESISILQSPTEALVGFPTNRRNEIDWVQALNDGLISPRANLDGSEEMVPMAMDILMEQTAMMPHVMFPHLAHTKWLSCENCHDAIFEPVKNGNPISMGKILKGEFCGRCHDRVAFSLFVCEKCHNTAQ